VKFIKIHPIKIKLGLYATTLEPLKATGTDGGPLVSFQNTNSNKNKKSTMIPFRSNRVARGGLYIINGGSREI
jgi:hypothetical protein